MNIKLQINRSLIAIDAFIRSKKKRRTNNKNVIIVFQQLFGDSVLIQNSISEYTKVFPREKGYSVKFLTKQANLSFMRDVLPLPEDIEFEVVDFKKYLENYSYYREITNKYNGTAGTVVVPGSSLSGDIFSASSDALRKVGLIRSVDVKRPVIMAIFSKIAYTEMVRPEIEEMVLQRHRKLINYLGEDDFLSKLPKLLNKNKIIDEKYVVMCPGASKYEKCWPIERFAIIADYIVSEFGLDIHLCGGSGEEEFANELISNLNHKNRIFSHIGTTSFSDWAAIVQHAELVLGNDSATMHIAAAARVKSICIAGVYDKYAFFPYKVDKVESVDRLPITILKDMPCELCRTIGYYAGYGNEECKKRIDEGKCASCIELVTVDDVRNAIDTLMKEK